MKKVFTLLTCMILLSCISLHAQSEAQAYDKLLTELFPADGPGGTALVSKSGKIVYHKAFGKANLELDVDMQPEHIFRIGSITKQFTACAILKLMEEGKLSLQDDITKFIEDYPTHGHNITIEHLLTHTSGIKSYTGMDKWTAETRKQDFTPEEMIDYFKDEPMDFDPGEDFRYNNSGYFLLGYIIEQLSGKTYEAYIEDTFFKPLGMKNSSYGNPYRIIKNRAAGYQPAGNGSYQNAAFLSMSQPYAAGSLLSTVEDINTWYQAVVDGKVISKSSLEQAHTDFKLNNGRSSEYGYGWFLGNIQGSRMFQHGGGINGYLTSSIYIPESELFVAVFSNCNCNAPGQVAMKMAGIAIGKPYDWKKIKLSKDELAEYEGVYSSEFMGKASIYFENGELYSAGEGRNKRKNIPFAKDKFFVEGTLTTFEYERDVQGKIAGMVALSQGLPVQWTRTDEKIVKRTAIKLSSEQLALYEGKYQLAPNFILSVFVDGKRIFAQATGQGPLEIFPYEKHQFFAKEIDATIRFNVAENKEIDSLTLFQGGEHEAKKIE